MHVLVYVHAVTVVEVTVVQGHERVARRRARARARVRIHRAPICVGKSALEFSEICFLLEVDGEKGEVGSGVRPKCRSGIGVRFSDLDPALD